MSTDMFPDAAIEYIINHQETNVTEQQPDDRIMIEEVPLVVDVTYHNGGEEKSVHVPLEAGCEPFILFQMKQSEGAIVLDITASLIEGEDELIETLEVFFETMLEERRLRGLIPLPVSQQDVDDADGEHR